MSAQTSSQEPAHPLLQTKHKTQLSYIDVLNVKLVCKTCVVASVVYSNHEYVNSILLFTAQPADKYGHKEERDVLQLCCPLSKVNHHLSMLIIRQAEAATALN